jgi:methylated-DNA-[protein]-cysteine S-methyltransferase
MTYALDSAVIATPVGAIRVSGNEATVHRIEILREPHAPRRADAPAILAAAEQLEAWFAGALHAFDLALAPASTPRGAVLRAGLVAVGYGETRSYGALATTLGSSPRAIGQLCARNPYPIVVPCHRILAAAGALGAYSAGDGPATKQWLLDHEQRHRKE